MHDTLVAIIDGAGPDITIGLYWESPDGGELREATWPAGWPLGVSAAWLEAEGVKVVRV